MYQPLLDPTAVMGRRIGAWLIDFAIAAVLSWIAAGIFLEGYNDIPGNLCDDDEPVCSTTLLGEEGWAAYDEASDTSVFIRWEGSWVPVTLFVGYGLVAFVLVEGLAGGSPGKLMTGLRVVRPDGTPAGPAKSALRFLLWVADGVPYCIPLVGIITGASSKGHRRVGDMAAGTFVVAKGAAGHPVAVPGVTGPTFAPPVAPGSPGAWGSGGWGPPSPGQAGGWGTPGPATSGFAPPTVPTDPLASGWAAPGAAPSPGDAASGWPTPSGTWAGEPQDTAGPEPAEVHGGGPTSPGDAPPPPAPGSSQPPTTSPWGETVTTWGDPSGHGPQWDPARGTYIQWEPDSSTWMAWDETHKEWRPI